MQALVGADPARDDIALLILRRTVGPPVISIVAEEAGHDV